MRTRMTMMIGICVTVAMTACSGDDAGSDTTAAPTTTTTIATTTTVRVTTTSVPVFTAEDALGVANAYFASYNAGDVEAVLALFEPDATFTDNFGATSAEDWEQLLVWNAAQGTALSESDCDAVPDNAGGMIVSCPHTNLDALVQAVAGPPVPIDMTLTITSEGISQWIWFFGSPDFNAVGRPFSRWMNANHPEKTEAVGFGNWSTAEEARENGLLTAQYAAEWATYLTENNCSYLEGC